MKRVCIHQPDFVPYVGFFDRLVTSDVFVLLDDVQFLRRGWHHRDKIKTLKGSDWLTLNLQKGDYHQKINEVILHPDRKAWVPGCLGLISENYRKAPFFAEVFSDVERIFNTPHKNLVEINLEFIRYLLKAFDIEIEMVFASEINVATTKTQRLIDLVKGVKGTHYLSGTGAVDYLEPSLFEDADIVLEIQDFQHPTYPQLHGNFIPYLSSLDLLFNCGPQAKDILRSR
jgi:hypothetical protein